MKQTLQVYADYCHVSLIMIYPSHHLLNFCDRKIKKHLQIYENNSYGLLRL